MARVRKAIIEEGSVKNVIRLDEDTGPAHLLGYPTCPEEFGPGDLYDGYSFSKAPAPAKEEKTDAVLIVEARKKRDGLLQISDGWVVPFLEKGLAVPAELLAYRDFLRDVPDQSEFPTAPIWPEKPSDAVLKSYASV